MNKIIIADTSCLIALERIKKLEILSKTFSVLITTKEVSEEFGSPLPSWLSVRNADDERKQKEFEAFLDKGEASAIALAIETQNSLLIIDEKKGRKIARELKIEIIGLLKVLLIAKEKGVISSVKDIIKELERANFRFSKNIVNEILINAKEI